MVPEERRAWHAGESYWAGERDINGISIGIELVNPGHEFGYRPFPKAQMAALVQLSRSLVFRHRIPPDRVLGHSDVAPRRKQDPGELFDWAGLAQAGVGLWVDYGAEGDVPPIATVQQLLSDFGYEAPRTGVLDEATRTVVMAFQRHFRPAWVDGEVDAETAVRLAALVDRARLTRMRRTPK